LFNGSLYSLREELHMAHVRRLQDAAVFAAAFCLLSADAVRGGQSREIDRPTPLTSTEMSVDVNGNVTHYFSLEVGPGEVTIVTKFSGSNLFLYIKDADGKDLGCSTLSVGSGQNIKRCSFTRKRKALLEVEVVAAREYSFRLSGAVSVAAGSATWLDGLPRQGILQLKMKDGSTKEIDLREVAAVSIR
jgi:hypothetical protein